MKRAERPAPTLVHVIWLWLVAMWPWVSVSFGAHVLVVVAWSAGLLGGPGLFEGGGIGEGDGFGGTSIEMEIAGPREDPPRGASSAGRQETPPPQPESQVTPPDQNAPELDGEHEVRTREEAREQRAQQDEVEREPRPPQTTGAVGDPSATDTAAPGENEQAAGTGGDDSTAGQAGGNATADILAAAGAAGDTLSARHALLPGGAMCDDPIRGTWRAQKWRSPDRTWVRFILHIEREGDEITGTITSRIWTGPPSDPRPRCTAFGFDNTWLMEADGRVHGDEMTFTSRRSRLVRQDCPGDNARYAPDNFRGRVDAVRETYQALNNDGAFDIDEPYTFRRVSCE